MHDCFMKAKKDWVQLSIAYANNYAAFINFNFLSNLKHVGMQTHRNQLLESSSYVHFELHEGLPRNMKETNMFLEENC